MTTTTPLAADERIALTLLDRHEAYHASLNAWLKEIIAHPEFTTSLNDYVAAQGWAEQVGDLEATVLAARPWRQDEFEEPRRHRRQQRDVYRLALAVLRHRLAGRPAGDVTTMLGTPAMRSAMVTTSLAAAIVEFHLAYLDHALQDVAGYLPEEDA